MLSISSTGSFAAPIANAAPAASSDDDRDPQGVGGGDLLSAMDPAMNAAFSVGQPTDQSGAAAILATTGSYVNGANQTMSRIDRGMERKLAELDALQGSDPDRAAKLEEELKLLQRLRDRIQLSIERVLDPLGEHDDDRTVEDRSDRTSEARLRRRHEEAELLEQRRQLLASTSVASIAPADASMVAGTYGAGRAAATGGVDGA